MTKFYRAFEDRFRGSRDLIRKRLAVYAPFVEAMRRIHSQPTAIDLGCGRGEWLELLRDAGVEAIGIDLNAGMLRAATARGLNVVRQDAIPYLATLPDASQTLISSFHMVEHIAFDQLQTLLLEAARVLRPAGILILETPNPENIKVATIGFNLDPTHRKPLPPDLLSFLVSHYGFERQVLLRLQEPPRVRKQEEFSLRDVLTAASPDYSVIGQKTGAAAELEATASLFEMTAGISMEEMADGFDRGLAKQRRRSRQLAADVAALIERLDAVAGTMEERLGRIEANMARIVDRLDHHEQALETLRQPSADSEETR